jgi:hypothetical protein
MSDDTSSGQHLLPVHILCLVQHHFKPLRKSNATPAIFRCDGCGSEEASSRVLPDCITCPVWFECTTCLPIHLFCHACADTYPRPDTIGIEPSSYQQPPLDSVAACLANHRGLTPLPKKNPAHAAARCDGCCRDVASSPSTMQWVRCGSCTPIHRFCGLCAWTYWSGDTAEPVRCGAGHALLPRVPTNAFKDTCAWCGAANTSVMGCRECSFDICLSCYAGASFAAARKADGERDPYNSAMGRPAAVHRLVPDVIGVVLQFACRRATEALKIGRTCWSWYKGLFAGSELWRQLYKHRWSGRDLPQTRFSMSRYRSRALAEMRLARRGLQRPLVHEEFTPIEHWTRLKGGKFDKQLCDSCVSCPFFAEGLRPCANEDITLPSVDGELHVPTRVSFCDVCSKKVYHVETQQEVEHHATLDHRIAFNSATPTVSSRDVRLGTVYRVLGNASDAGAGAFAHLNAMLGELKVICPTIRLRPCDRIMVQGLRTTLTFEVQFAPTQAPHEEKTSIQKYVYIVPPSTALACELPGDALRSASPEKHAELIEKQNRRF